LLVANPGGHLEELWSLQSRLNTSRDTRTWVTWDSPHSRALLKDEDCHFVDRARPRDVLAALRNARSAQRIMGGGRWSRVISTGSVMAVPFFVVARANGIACHYIESAARVAGPSLTGRVLEWVPGVHRYAQHKSWADRRTWSYAGSVFDAFIPSPSNTPARSPQAVERVVVTLGSNSFDFRRLVEGILDVLPPGADVLWQTGATDVTGLGIQSCEALPADDLAAAMRKADLVIAHAGVGSALTALRSGHAPLLVPRRRHRGEHVDDHQVEIARHLVSRGIAVACDADMLNADIIAVAASMSVHPMIAPMVLLNDEPPRAVTHLVRRAHHGSP